MNINFFSYIDSHTHLAHNLQETSYFTDARPETLIRYMKRTNIRYALVYATYINSKNDISNQQVKHVVEKYAPHLIGVGAIDINNFEGTFNSAKKYWSGGFFRAIKLYPTYQYYSLNNPLLDKIYSFCQENLVPLIIHVGKCRKTPFKIKLSEIEGLLAKYPKLIIVIPHFGMPYVKQTLDLMIKHKDRPIYVDTSCLWPGLEDGFLKKLLNHYKLLGLSSSRVLFGTDFPLSKADVLINQINMSNFCSKEKREIFYGNAMSLFRITRPYCKKMLSEEIKEVMIIPTSNCNRNCVYCLERNSSKSKSPMSLDDFCRVLKKATKENISKISFFGGEPTLWPHLMGAILMIKSKRMEVDLFTNGTSSFDEMPEVDILRLHLNTADKNIRKKLEYASRGRFQLHGNITVSRYLDTEDIGEMLQGTEHYTSITLMLDRTEKDKVNNQRNFDKAASFKNFPNVLVEVIVPFCQFRHDQKLMMKTDNSFMEVKCFPGWKKIVVDQDMNIKNCFASDVTLEFTEHVSLKEARNILYEENKNELNKLPLEECIECVDRRSNTCYGGCSNWKKELARHMEREIA